MTGLLRAETIKVVRRKLLWVLLGIVVFVTAFSAVLTFVAADLLGPEQLGGLDIPTKPDAYLLAFQQAAGNAWVAVILAAVLWGGEFSNRTWAISLTWEARRWMHVAAKLVVIALAASLVAMASAVVYSVFVAGFADGSGFLSFTGLTLAAGELLLVQAVWVAVGLASAALLRSTGLAVGLALAFTFVEQAVLFAWRQYRDFSIGAASTAIFGVDVLGVPGDFPGELQSAFVLVGWGLVAIAAAWAAATFRDA